MEESNPAKKTGGLLIRWTGRLALLLNLLKSYF